MSNEPNPELTPELRAHIDAAPLPPPEIMDRIADMLYGDHDTEDKDKVTSRE